MREKGKSRRRRRGTTLTETLIALAVFAILTAAIATGTVVAGRVYRESTIAAEAQTLVSTLSQSIAGELRYAKNIHMDGEVPVFDSMTFGPGVTLQSSQKGTICVVAADGTRSYELLSKKNYTQGLETEIELSYDGRVFHYLLKVKTPETELKEQSMTIAPLNP